MQQSHGLFATAELLVIFIIGLFSIYDRLIFNICELANLLQIRLNVQRSWAADLRSDTENISEEQSHHGMQCIPGKVQTNSLVSVTKQIKTNRLKVTIERLALQLVKNVCRKTDHGETALSLRSVKDNLFSCLCIQWAVIYLWDVTFAHSVCSHCQPIRYVTAASAAELRKSSITRVISEYFKYSSKTGFY